MAEHIDVLKANLAKYRAYNAMRLERMRHVTPKRKAAIVDLVPTLLHLNVKGLPTYIHSNECISGIYCYSIPKEHFEQLKSLFPGVRLDIHLGKEAHAQPHRIKSLLLIGSVGSIAQCDDSDFDYWVCVKEDEFSPAGLEDIRERLQHLEVWALEQFDLELHFFVMDIEKVRRNEFGGTDKESAGSSLAKLLKEEFYRTTVHVAGKLPFWWIVPPGANDEQYAIYKKIAVRSKDFESKSLIDLGNVDKIETDEFFGAAIWQISKAMDSPHKSVLKMAMLELYLDSEQKMPLLCTIFKRRVFNNSGGYKLYDILLDPYAILMDAILEFYKNKNNEEGQNLFQICLYVKAKANLDGSGGQDFDESAFKEIIFSYYIVLWGWNQETLADLNDFRNWSFDKVYSLGKRVHDMMLAIYNRISERLKADPNWQSLIRPEDLTVLGRKLSSFYEKKPFKLPFIMRAFEGGLIQESVTFYANNPKQLPQRWSLFSGQKTTKDIENPEIQVLESREDLAILMIWAIFNQIIDAKTSMYLIPSASDLKLTDLVDLRSEVLQTLPYAQISSLTKADILSPPFSVNTLIIGNLTSKRAFRTLEQATIAYRTSWGEVYCRAFPRNPSEYLKDCIVENAPGSRPDQYRFFLPKGSSAKPARIEIESFIVKACAQGNRKKNEAS